MTLLRLKISSSHSGIIMWIISNIKIYRASLFALIVTKKSIHFVVGM